MKLPFFRAALALLLFTGTLHAQLFEHIVIVVQENRTPDNLFGSNPNFEPGVDIATSSVSKLGVTVASTPRPLADCYDLGHKHTNWVSEFKNGFISQPFTSSAKCTSPPHPKMVYVDNSTGQIQPYFDIASAYGWANRMFQTNQGPSFAAHQFLLSGTSSPSTNSNLFADDNPTPTGGNAAGCAALTSTATFIDPTGAITTGFPCFERPTLTDELTAANLSWRWYSVSQNYPWTAPNAIQHICVPVNSLCTGPEWANVVIGPAKLLTDIGNCNLANVAWATPSGQYSDHPLQNRGTGPSWVASIVNSIGNSPCGYWQNTAVLITWDDWGGFFDHVSPPQLGQPNGWGKSYVYGFRVPLLVVSAYTPSGYVDNATHDFGSILHFVESNFGLGLIGPGFYADAYADDLSGFFPLTTGRDFSAINSAPFAATQKMTLPDDDGDDD